MGGGPSLPSGSSVASFLFGCAAVFAAGIAVIVFVPWQLVIAAVAAGTVFASSSLVDLTLTGRHPAIRALATSSIRLLAATIIAIVTAGLSDRLLFVAMA